MGSSSTSEKGFSLRYLIVFLCAGGFFTSHLARLNWTALIPFAETPLNLSKTMSGELVSAAFFMYAIMQIPAGILSDKIDNVKMLGTALTFMGIITVITGFANSFVQILILRLLTGLAAGFIFPPSLRLVTVSFPKSQKGRAIGFFFMGPSFALIFMGLVLPPVAISYGWQWGFVVSGIPGIILGLLVFTLLRKVTTNKEEKSIQSPAIPYKNKIKRVFTNTGLLLCFIGTFFASFSTGGTKVWLLDYLIKDIGIASITAGLILSAFSFINIFNKPISGYIADKSRRKKIVIALALLSTAIFYYLFTIQTDMITAVALVFGLAIVQGSYVSSSNALVTDLSTKETLGIAIAANNMMAMFSYVVQPVFSGYLMDVTGLYAWVWYLSVIVSVLSALFFALVKE